MSTPPEANDHLLEDAEKGPSLGAYMLILVMIAIIVIVVLALMGPSVGNIFTYGSATL